MALERKPGSSRGRASVDWEEAFQYYARLPAPERGYKAVADHYQVSVRTVETHGREQGWKQRLRQLQAEAEAVADAQLSEAQAAKLSELDLLIDASLTTYARQLQAGAVKVVPSDLLRLFKLRDELWAREAAATSATRQEAVSSEEPTETRERRNFEIVRALQEAGVFDRLQQAALAETNPGGETG